MSRRTLIKASGTAAGMALIPSLTEAKSNSVVNSNLVAKQKFEFSVN